jgi:2'-5' RNA ligase
LAESAIDIVVDHPAFGQLPYWRAMAAFGVPPHVSVLFPWRQPPLDETDIADLRRALTGLPRFPIEFDSVQCFDRGVVYAALRDSGSLTQLMRKVWSAFPETPPYGGEFAEPTPHLTLAKCSPDDLEGTHAELTRTLAGRLPVQFEVSSVAVLVEAEDGIWQEAARVGLTASGSHSAA